MCRMPEAHESRVGRVTVSVIKQLAQRTALDGSQTVVRRRHRHRFVVAGLASRAERVIALDHSPAMLDVARENLKRLGVSNVKLAEADAGALPLPDDSVDAAVATMVLHRAETRRQCSPRRRVARLGG